MTCTDHSRHSFQNLLVSKKNMVASVLGFYKEKEKTIIKKKKNAFVRSVHPAPQGQNYHGRSDGIRPCVIAALILTWSDSCCLLGVLFAAGGEKGKKKEDSVRSCDHCFGWNVSGFLLRPSWHLKPIQPVCSMRSFTHSRRPQNPPSEACHKTDLICTAHICTLISLK